MCCLAMNCRDFLLSYFLFVDVPNSKDCVVNAHRNISTGQVRLLDQIINQAIWLDGPRHKKR
jgi:hypothetical protein